MVTEMKLLFLRSLHSGEGSRPSTVPFHKAGVTVEEHTGNCGQTGTEEGLQHQAKMLTFYPIGSRVFEKFHVGANDNSGTGRHED